MRVRPHVSVQARRDVLGDLQVHDLTVASHLGRSISGPNGRADRSTSGSTANFPPTSGSRCFPDRVMDSIVGKPLPHHVAVIGAVGGLGSAILRVCRAEGIAFTAIVRSRPERITNVPQGSQVAVVASLADQAALTSAFSGADVVLTALAVTPTSNGPTSLLSGNAIQVEAAMLAAGVDRLIIINTLLVSLPGRPASRAMRFFSSMPGRIGRGAREQQAVVDALAEGAFSSLRWTLVRAGLNRHGMDELPVAAADWPGAPNSWMPVSYDAMARWMIEEAAAGRFVKAAPLVSRGR